MIPEMYVTKYIHLFFSFNCSDINTIQEGIGDKISLIVQFSSTFVAGIIIGFVHGWKLTLVILSVSPLLVASGAVWSYVSR